MGSGKVTRCLAWLTKRNDYGNQGHEAWGGRWGGSLVRARGECAWLAAAGTWTRMRVSSGLHPCVGKMRPWGSGAWRGGNAEKRCVHVPYTAGAPRGQQRASSDILGRSFGF